MLEALYGQRRSPRGQMVTWSNSLTSPRRTRRSSCYILWRNGVPVAIICFIMLLHMLVATVAGFVLNSDKVLVMVSQGPIRLSSATCWLRARFINTRTHHSTSFISKAFLPPQSRPQPTIQSTTFGEIWALSPIAKSWQWARSFSNSTTKVKISNNLDCIRSPLISITINRGERWSSNKRKLVSCPRSLSYNNSNPRMVPPAPEEQTTSTRLDRSSFSRSSRVLTLLSSSIRTRTQAVTWTKFSSSSRSSRLSDRVGQASLAHQVESICPTKEFLLTSRTNSSRPASCRPSNSSSRISNSSSAWPLWTIITITRHLKPPKAITITIVHGQLASTQPSWLQATSSSSSSITIPQLAIPVTIMSIISSLIARRRQVCHLASSLWNKRQRLIWTTRPKLPIIIL